MTLLGFTRDQFGGAFEGGADVEAAEEDVDVEVRITAGEEDGGAQKPLLARDEERDVNPDTAPREDDANVAAAAAAAEAGEEKPVISRAERRRRIKAEIQRLSQGDEPIYYQRRLW